jgi:REP-associated tyrosine transposase
LYAAIVDRVVREHQLIVHTYCEMTNHVHLLLETPQANLDTCMQVLNGTYAMWINRLRKRCGHLFHARYNPVLVQTDEHFREVVRYVVLNPVRAGICGRAEEWRWSAHRALAGLEYAPPFLTTTRVLELFGDTPREAQQAYARFVQAGSPFSSVAGILALT